MIHRRFRVTGRVQGVGFRWYVRRVAHEMGLWGSVRNEPDGSVTVLAGGSADALTRLRDALQVGPEGAQVETVVELPMAATDAPLDFPFRIDR